MKHRIFSGLAAALLVAVCGTSHAQEVLICDIPMTAELAGSASTATGNLVLFGDDQAGTITVTVTHNVPSATSIEIRTGITGQTGSLISNLGGATASPTTYALTPTEANDVITSGFNWYIAVNNATFPAPGGAIRANGSTCFTFNPEGEGEAGSEEGEGVPEGLNDYSCVINFNGSQMVPSNGASATGQATIEFVDATNATFILQHNVLDSGDISVFKGAPGETGTLVRRLGSDNTILFMTWTKAELEDYTSEPHYIQVDSQSGASSSIRGDIVGCAFDDGVEEGEGITEGEAAAEAEGEPLPCEDFPEGEAADLLCNVELTGSAVVPPTTSTFTGGVQITGPIPGDGQYLLVVRHDVPSPTSISIFQGSPGQAGNLFLSFSSNLGCPFVQLLSPNFFQVLGANPLYVEINSSGDTNATIRADLICPLATDGEVEGEGEGEGLPVEGEGEGQGQDLRGLADGLLFVFKLADGDQSGTLQKTEADFVAPQMTDEQFDILDSNDDNALSTGELHRYAGPVRVHNGDVDGDMVLSLAELLRLIQLYNAGLYDCVDPAGSTEDGFGPGDAKGDAAPPCEAHAADYIGGVDFEINLSELLRVIQLFNYGTYSYCPSPSALDDNYCTEIPAP